MVTRALVFAVLAIAAPAHAAEPQCRIVDLSFAAAAPTGDSGERPQIVAWIEDAAGNFVDTVYITHATGTFGIGNRPGRFDFNSGFRWPYGRRTTTFPVWSNKHGLVWPELIFQDSVILGQTEADNRLSHAMDHSSVDGYFCRPQFGADATSCPSAINRVDKGMFGTNQSRYPPRNDLSVLSEDHVDVGMFGVLNPFDAVSQPTPPYGVDAAASYAVPFELPAGEYVLWVEVAKEIDMNGSYNPTFYPSPDVAFGNYGEAYRGQPSVVYRVPFSLVGDSTVASTSDYAGYGDPDGLDGAVRPPDATISSDIGTGAGRLALLSEGGETYRVRVATRREDDTIAPSIPTQVNVADVTSSQATIELVAPGDDGTLGEVKGYEVRYRIGESITEDNFATATNIIIDATLVGPGEVQTLVIAGLLPETDYSIGIRALDNCRNASPLVAFDITTPERLAGEVDACFIATAAYGSTLAADVGFLRAFRDELLKQSPLGELAVEAYYTFGPPAAGVIGESDLLRATARELLAPIVAGLRPPPHR